MVRVGDVSVSSSMVRMWILFPDLTKLRDGPHTVINLISKEDANQAKAKKDQDEIDEVWGSMEALPDDDEQ